MTTTGWQTDESIIEWLLEDDPAVKWQVHRDLLNSDESSVERERARVAEEGWEHGY